MYFIISHYQATTNNPGFEGSHFCIFGKSHTKVYDSRTSDNIISKYEVSNEKMTHNWKYAVGGMRSTPYCDSAYNIGFHDGKHEYAIKELDANR